MLHCDWFLGATHQTEALYTSYTVQLQCSELLNQSRGVLTNVHLRKGVLTPQVTRVRERALGSKLVALLPVFYSDVNVLDFLFMWNNLLHHKHIDQFLLVLLIMEPPGEKNRNQSLSNQGSHIGARIENTLSDVIRWSRDNDLDVRTFFLNHTVRHHRVQKRILTELQEENENSVILFAKPKIKFDEKFLYKCRVFVRPGKQIYRPYALRSPEDVRNNEQSPSFLWTSSGSPLCIHLTDLLDINYRKRKRKRTKTSGPDRIKPIRIIYSYDDTVQIRT